MTAYSIVSSAAIVCILAFFAFASATAAEPYKILDEKPKVIFYLSNSHKGTTGLQRHLNHAGYDHIKVHQNLFGFLLKMDPKTGEISSRSPLPGIKKEHEALFPGLPAVIVYQNNVPAIDPLPEEAAARAAELEKRKDWVAKTGGEYFAVLREKVKAEGFMDLYFLNHHYSKGPDQSEVTHPYFLETIAEYNKLVGYEVGIDNWPITKKYFPRTVGADFWHNNEFGRLAKTYPLMEAFAKNSGVTEYEKIDLDQALVDYEAENKEIVDVHIHGRGTTYRVGDTIEVRWKMKEPDLYPLVNIYLGINGGKNRAMLGENIPSSHERYRLTIPATGNFGKPHSDQVTEGSFVDDACRIRVAAAGLKSEYAVTNKTIETFRIVAADDTVPSDAPRLGPMPAFPEEQQHAFADGGSYRIAHWPGFYRAAIAFAIHDDGSPELFDLLETASGREHPDLITVIATSEDAGRHDALRKMGHEVVNALPVQAGASQTTYRDLPVDMETVQAYHLEIGSELAIRNLVERLLDTRSAAFVTYGSRGEDFEAQLNALHDYHAELWNGPMQHLLTYVAQRRSAKLEPVALKGKFGPWTLALTDNLPDPAAVPLSIQAPLPHHQVRLGSCQQNGVERAARKMQAHGTKGRAYYVRFDAIPDAGEIVIGR